MLKDLNIEEEYRSDTTPPLLFYIDCLKNSIQFDRAAGYFSSSGLSEASKGFAHFINNDGIIRLVVSPAFNEKDIQAIIAGYKSRNEIITDVLIRSISEIDTHIQQHRFEALAWLVATNKLDIKIAIKVDKNGIPEPKIYHEKMGIFSDQNGDSVAFTGSTNESKGGWIDNFESIDVYKSWLDAENGRVNRKKQNFEKLWNNTTKLLSVEPLPKAVEKVIINKRPNSPPKFDPIEKKSKFTLINTIKSKIKYPDWLSLYPYQKAHIEEWEKNEYQGFFCMATGTGKTITALAAATDLYHKLDKLFVFVCCPNTHLVNQWADESKKFGYEPILAFESSKKWEGILKKAVSSFLRNSDGVLMVITTQTTLTHSSKRLISIIDNIKSNSKLFIADEAHNLGAYKTRTNLPTDLKFKIALSATPVRYFDDIGSKFLNTYFGKQLPVKPEVDLEFAINNDFLCKYKYYPHIVYLTDKETDEYYQISKKIQKLFFLIDVDDDDTPLQRLYENRVAILNNAENKYNSLRSTLKKYIPINKSLFYCSDKQIGTVINILNNEFNIFSKKVTYEDNQSTRKIIFSEFKKGLVDAMCAIGVLDEGLDIPSIRNAFFLSSSGNPKQFIQRRGRVLRKEKGIDKIAIIHDYISIPIENKDYDIDIVSKALIKELKRFKEFADLADNRLEAREKVVKLALNQGIVI